MPASDGIPLAEFIQDQFELIDWNELRPIIGELDAKSRFFQAQLRPAERLETLTRADWNELLAHIFAIRKHHQVLAADDERCLPSAVHDLLYGENPDLSERLNAFLAALDVINPEIGVDLAGEFLHFTFPDRYWLWARWMYNAATHTGTLPLLMDGDKELRGATPGETYLQVGRAIVMVTQVKDAEWLFHGGLTDAPLERPFAIDTFLAASYGAYLYGITAWRLTREFHKVLPPLPRLIRRLLGLQVEKRTA
ncbi:MAG: hypothetical protein HY741_22030 [Chloroflexi bacterium]|nr:hypothetical protein [Chloroflexota bacterium]